MTPNEMRQWAALLNAQADGKQLQFNPQVAKRGDPWPLPDDYWRDETLYDWGVCANASNKWRVKPDAPALPPKPSQEWLDKHGVELTGECRVPVVEDYGWHSPMLTSGHDQLSKPHSAYGVGLADDQQYGHIRWILRKRAPSVEPWTLDTVPLPLVVRHKRGDGMLHMIDTAGLEVVTAGPNIITYKSLACDWVRRDGSPCGIVK